jgi:hypothetical protein
MRGIARTATTIAVTLLVALSVQRVLASDVTRGRATLGAERIHMVAGDDRQTTGQQGFFVPIRGAKLGLIIPEGERGLIVGRFSADDECSGGSPHDACRLAMRLTGPGLPVDGEALHGSQDFFDSVEGTGHELEAHAEEGFVDDLGPGTYTLQASFLTDSGNRFRLHSWLMTAEFWRSA